MLIRGIDDDEKAEASPPLQPPREITPSKEEQPPLGSRAGPSSMVVRPPDSSAAAAIVAGSASIDSPSRRRGGPSPEVRRWVGSAPEARRRGGSPPEERHRGESPLETRRRDFSPPFRGRRSPPDLARRRGESPLELRRRGSPSSPHPRYLRVNEDQGYPMHSVSPPCRRRSIDTHIDLDFMDTTGPRYVQRFQGIIRRDGRFRDGSPPVHGTGRGGGCGRTSGRVYIPSRRAPPSFDRDYAHKNDPNLSPREGDWICQNPVCGNLNFARRSHCNSCNKHRYAADLHEPIRSPGHNFFPSPLPFHRSPVRLPGGPPPNRAVPREHGRYHSLPRGNWGLNDLRDLPPHVDSPFIHRERIDYREDVMEYRSREKFEWDERDRNGFLPDRRGGRIQSISPRGRCGRDFRGRSRSPIGERPVKFMGRGRGERDYGDRGYMGHDGYSRNGDDSFPIRGRGDRRVLGQGRNGKV